MNIDKIKALQAVIAVQPHVAVSADAGFNMQDFKHPCGTPSCIDGWCGFIEEANDDFFGSCHVAGALEIDPEIASWLCAVGDDQHYASWYKVTPAQAVQALQNVIDGCDVKGVWAHLKGQS
jgi:hypothetical protein